MSPLEIENTLRYHLEHLLPHHESSEVYEYATLPGGKLFRPSLVWSALRDLDPVLYSQSILNKNSGRGANIAPNIVTTASKLASSYDKASASPSSN